MKIRNIINSTIALFMVLTFASCDALDLKPISFITNESFWQTEDDVKGALNGIYVQLRGAAEHDLYILGEARSEILTVGIGGYGGYDIYYYNTLTQANMPISWIRYYQIVNSCNLLLKYAPNVTFNNETSRNKMLAQAYTMRAFMYFVMTRTWGDLIIHTDPIENTNSEVLYKERRPQTEVFQLIKDDLEKALSLYPDDNFGDQRAMWSKPATLALKAEVYLWSGKKMNGGSSDIETALNALNSIKTDKLRLQPDFADVFAYDNKGNDEILMSVRFQDLESGINYFRYMWIHASAVPGDAPQEVKDIVYPIGPGQGIIVASDEYRKQYTEDDTRKNASFLEIYSKDQETGENKFYVSVVLKGKGLVRDGDRIFADDIILYRYADILLMKAEAKNALGQDPSAEINEVRKRAYKDKYEEGFCWIDVNSTYLKARIKTNGVFDVLSMSLFTMTTLPDWYFVAIINSEFISLYVDNFINNTSHFQINDARQLPIIIPQKETFESLQKLVADCISLKKTVTTDDFLMGEKQYELDRLVRLLYGVED